MTMTMTDRIDKQIERRRRLTTITPKMRELRLYSLGENVAYINLVDEIPRLSDTPGVKSRRVTGLMEIKHGHLYVFASGHAELRMEGHLVKSLEVGDIFGECEMLGQTMLGSEVASTSGRILDLDENHVSDYIERYPLMLVALVGGHLARSKKAHFAAQFLPATVRLARFLLEHAIGREVAGFTHDDIGRILGTYRETVTYALLVLEREGIIHIGRKRIEIRNEGALKKAANL